MGGTNGYKAEDILHCTFCGITLVGSDTNWHVEYEDLGMQTWGDETIHMKSETIVCEDCEGLEDVIKFYVKYLEDILMMAPNKGSFNTNEAKPVPSWLEDQIHGQMKDDRKIECFEIRYLAKR